MREVPHDAVVKKYLPLQPPGPRDYPIVHNGEEKKYHFL